LKVAGKEDLPIAHSGFVLGTLFTALPARSDVIILLECDDVCAALKECQDMERKQLDPAVYVNSPQWREMLMEWRRKDVRGLYRTVDDELDRNFFRMRSIAIWDALETMEHGVSERDNPSTFLA
jgi:hypothetical protein